MDNLSAAEVLNLLDIKAYLNLLHKPMPTAEDGIFELLRADHFVKQADNGTWRISNAGAVLLGADLSSFPTVHHKALRVITYPEDSKLTASNDRTFDQGYAAGFADILEYIYSQIPKRERISSSGFRAVDAAFPMIAIRETLANAMVHQDFNILGSGPIVEIFRSRLEILSPGAPVIDIKRFVDLNSSKRNPKIAEFIRMVRICEGRGSGIDRALEEIEAGALPAPKFEATPAGVRVTLYSARDFAHMDRDARMRACYLHCCLKFVSGELMTNSSLRARFELPSDKISLISKLIKECVNEGLIEPEKEGVGAKALRYVPAWA